MHIHKYCPRLGVSSPLHPCLIPSSSACLGCPCPLCPQACRAWGQAALCPAVTRGLCRASSGTQSEPPSSSSLAAQLGEGFTFFPLFLFLKEAFLAESEAERGRGLPQSSVLHPSPAPDPEGSRSVRLGWADLGWTPVPTELLHHSPPQQGREGLKTGKIPQRRGFDKGSL